MTPRFARDYGMYHIFLLKSLTALTLQLDYILQAFFAFSIASSFILTLIFPSSLFPFLSVGIKVTYFEQSPNSDLLACEVFRLWAFFNQFINLVYVFFCKLRIKVNGK